VLCSFTSCLDFSGFFHGLLLCKTSQPLLQPACGTSLVREVMPLSTDKFIAQDKLLAGHSSTMLDQWPWDLS
jgi:hypothetical protein